LYILKQAFQNICFVFVLVLFMMDPHLLTTSENEIKFFEELKEDNNSIL